MSEASKLSNVGKETTLILSESVDWHIRQMVGLLSEYPAENFDTELIDECQPGFLVYPVVEAFRLHKTEQSATKSELYRRFGNQSFPEVARDRNRIIKELNLIRESTSDGGEDHRLFLLRMLSKAAYAHGQLAMLLKESQ